LNALLGSEVYRVAMDASCIFCRIVAGDVTAEVVHETETTFAFRDVTPEAPVHVLVVPRTHLATVAAVAADEPGTLVDMIGAAAAVAKQEGLEGGYRLVANSGPDAQQTVFHAHLHILGGRQMAWPPG
jgi:histidine triad (HIT) family protein